MAQGGSCGQVASGRDRRPEMGGGGGGHVGGRGGVEPWEAGWILVEVATLQTQHPPADFLSSHLFIYSNQNSFFPAKTFSFPIIFFCL